MKTSNQLMTKSVSCSMEEVVSEVEAKVEVAGLGRRPLQAAFLALDQLNVEEIFKQPACDEGSPSGT